MELAAAIDTSPNAVGIAESELYFMTPEEVGVALDTMQSLGVTQVRIFVPWRAAEPVPGVYNWADVDKVVDAAYERGMAVLGAVTSTPTWASDVQNSAYGAPRNPEDFGRFMGALAERYGAGEGDPETARISAYEIWNEPQSFVFWNPRPDPAAYTELLKAGYTAVKEVDPTGTVVGGVVTAGLTWGGVNINPVEFVQTMYESGAAGYFDALSYHPYNYDWKFGDGFGNSISAVGQLQAMQALMEQYGDGEKDVWTSEYGLPTSYVSEEQQAEFIGDFLDTWSELDGVGPQFIYSLVDRNSASTDVEDTWGLFRDDYTPKQAAAVVQAWIAENGPIPDGGIPVDELPPLEEVPTTPVEPAEPEEPEAPADPAQAMADAWAEATQNWQNSLAEAAANWQDSWAQAAANWQDSWAQAAANLAAARQQPSAQTPATTALRAAAEEDTTTEEGTAAGAEAPVARTTPAPETEAPSTATDPNLDGSDAARAEVVAATEAEAPAPPQQQRPAATESPSTSTESDSAATESTDTRTAHQAERAERQPERAERRAERQAERAARQAEQAERAAESTGESSDSSDSSDSQATTDSSNAESSTSEGSSGQE
ncbi:cellulase family glycosylhydrolase [Mycobacterium sp. C31M]